MWKSVTRFRLAGSIVEDGPVVPGDDRCRCVCHKKPGTVHAAPCCQTCPRCRQNIVAAQFASHVTRCVAS